MSSAISTSGYISPREKELQAELLYCAGQGDIQRVRHLVEIKRVPVNCVDVIGLTPLLKAARQGHTEVARYLLQNRARLDMANNNDHTALACCIIRDDIELTALLLEYRANVNIRIFQRHSPLGYAISRGSVGMVTLLLQHGVETRKVLYGNCKRSALFLSCHFSNVEIIQLLLDHDDGLYINTYSRKSGDDPALSPLCVACQKNNLETAKVLIDHGARIIFPGVYPESPSPLTQAIEKGSLELVRLLLNSSPFSRSSSAENITPLLETDFLHPLTMPLAAALRDSKLEVAQLLVDHGANDSSGSVLWACATHGWSEGAKFLLRRTGADVNLPYYSGQTPLFAAASNGRVELVKVLLGAQADVSIRDNNGETPLGAAFHQGHTGIVYLLLRTSPHVWWRLYCICQELDRR